MKSRKSGNDTSPVRPKKILRDSVALVFKKGNVWALAVGVLLGASFGAVVNSLANDLIMQAIAKFLGFKGVEGMAFGVTQRDPVTNLPIDGIKYGKFLSVVLSFLIVAVFLVLITAIGLFIWRNINRRNAKNPHGLSVDEQILEELRKMNASKKK